MQKRWVKGGVVFTLVDQRAKVARSQVVRIPLFRPQIIVLIEVGSWLSAGLQANPQRPPKNRYGQ